MKNELKIMALVIILYRVLPSCYHGDLFVTPIISLLSSITGLLLYVIVCYHGIYLLNR